MQCLEERLQKLNKSQEVTTGSGTINSTYVSNAERNHYVRMGKVVTYQFTVTCKGNWGNTTEFITGLPRPITDTRFVGVNAASEGRAMRFAIGPNGSIYNAYSYTTPNEGNVIEGSLTYITSD